MSPGWLQSWRRRRQGLCGVCGSPLMPQVLADCSGQRSSVSVVFKQLPALTCKNPTHPKRYVDAEFGSQLIDQLLWGKSDVPVSITKAGERQYCHKCGERIEGPTVTSVRVSGKLVVYDHSIPVEVSAPGAVCRACGCEQIFASRDAGYEISEAIVEAFKAADLKP